MLSTPTARAASRQLVWRLESGGWTTSEASNLVALVHGLKPSKTGWAVREIEHLRFLEAMVRSGRIDR